MKRKLCVSLLLVLSLICSCSVFTVSAKTKKIKLSQTKVTLNVGKSKTLRVKNAGDKVKWSVSGKKVVSIKPSKNKCKVTAKAAGKAVIKAKYKKKTYKCTVTVKGTSSTSTQNASKTNTTTQKSSEKSENDSKEEKQTNTSHKHTWSDWSTKKVATCTEDGKRTRKCSCGETETENIPATGHEYETAIYEWSEDGLSCRGVRVCKNDVNHVETENSIITSAVKKAATCTEKGTTTYIATFKNEAFSTQTKDIRDIPATGHKYGTVTYKWSGTTKCTASRVCENDASHVETEDANITSEVTTAATCIKNGSTTYTATFKNQAFTTQTKEKNDVPAIGHTPKNGVCMACGEYIEGLYDASGKFLCSFGESGILLGTGNAKTILENDYPTAVKLVLPHCKKISSMEFAQCNQLQSVVITDSVTIEESAFQKCSNLSDVTMPKGLTTIGENAFRGCESLNNIILPEGLTTIGENAFFNCTSLVNITIPSGVTTIKARTFAGCTNLQKVSLPSSLISIEEFAFADTKISTLKIPKSVVSIGNSAFVGISTIMYVGSATSTDRWGASHWEKIDWESY